jgi:hypothetical protein
MLVKVLCGDSIAARRRFASEGNVTFEDLMRVASDFDVRAVTIEGLTSVRYLLLATVGIVTVIAAIWSPGLSWSHDTLHFDERLDRYPVRAYRNGVRRYRAAVLYSGQLFRAGTLDGVALTSNSFLVQCPTTPASLAPFPLFKPRRIKHLVVEPRRWMSAAGHRQAMPRP